MKLSFFMCVLAGLCFSTVDASALAKEFKISISPRFKGLRDDEPKEARAARAKVVRELIAKDSKKPLTQELRIGELVFEIEQVFSQSPKGGYVLGTQDGGPHVVQIKGDSCRIENQGKSEWIQRSRLASFSAIELALAAYLREHPDEAYAWQCRAEFRWVARKYDDAISDMTHAIRLQPKNAGFFAFRAMLWTFRKKLEPAIEDCNEAHRLEPQNPEPVGLRGMAYFLLSGNESLALPDFQEAVRLGKKDPELLAMCGMLKALDGKLKEAVADFTAAIEVLSADAADRSQKQFTYFALRSGARSELGEIDAAIVDVSKAIELEPTIEILIEDRADMYVRRKEFTKAVEDYSRVLDLDPDLIGVRSKLGNALWKSGELDKAAECFAEVLRRDPASYNGFMGRGAVRYQKRNWDGAIEDFSAANRIENDEPEPLEWRAACWKAKGDDAKAKMDLQKWEEIKRRQATRLFDEQIER